MRSLQERERISNINMLQRFGVTRETALLFVDAKQLEVLSGTQIFHSRSVRETAVERHNAVNAGDAS